MKAEDLLFYIKYGINDNNGKNKSFDIFDYYTLSKGVTPTDFIDKIKNSISKDELIKIKRFFYNNEGTTLSLDDKMIKQIIDTKVEINTKRDKSGFPIAGTGKIITNEEKKLVIEYILNHNMPLTTKMYSLAMKRYINGELDTKLNEHKSL